MADIKLTKTELRTQQLKFERLKKYLPTLQLKKAMLQTEVALAQGEIDRHGDEFAIMEQYIEKYAKLFTDRRAVDLFAAVEITQVDRRSENIAGVDIPILEKVHFAPSTYSLFDTPLWMDSAVASVQKLRVIREKIRIAEERKALLARELREVSIRVNLFEKILIPRAQDNIRKIKIFLGDQQLAAVSQAKVAKKKIEERAS